MSLEKLGEALVHTVIGMGTVFIILIIISLIIYLFKYIPKVQEWFAARKAKDLPAAPAPVAPAAEPEAVQEDETDETELVAVITAAVAAAMGKENSDGFIVRSIRRSKGNRW